MTTTDRPRLRRKAPSTAEWIRIRPVFERLYVRENLTLPKISAILARDHDFHATLCMYKLRISKWGLKKNFKLAELEAAALTLGHFVQAGLNAPTAIIGNREVPIERAKRHFRESFLVDSQNQSSRGKTVTPATPSQRSGPPACTLRDRKRRFNPARRSAAIPRILLQQSTESHILESTLSAVNNYYGWRLTQDEEYFAIHTYDAGHHDATAWLLHPADVFNDLRGSFNALKDGAYLAFRVSIQQFCSQARILLLQQHPSLLESIISPCVGGYEGIAGQLLHSIFSHLNSLASRLVAQSHPISMVLRLLESHEGQTRDFQLVLRLMREIAGRQSNSNIETIFELEYVMAETSVENDDFDTASEICGSLLQRYVNKLGERDEFSRRALYLLGYLNFQFDLSSVAEEILLRVLTLDDSYEQDFETSAWVSICAMQILGFLYDGIGEMAEAEKFLSQAQAATCRYWGADDGRARRSLHHLKQFRRRLSHEENTPELNEEDGADILEELETRLAQVGLEETTEVGRYAARAEPWNDWNTEMQRPRSRTSVPNTQSSRDSPVSTSVMTTENEDEDLMEVGSRSCAALEPAVSCDLGPGQPSEDDEYEGLPSTHYPAQDSIHVNGRGDFSFESQETNFDVYDDGSVPATTMAEAASTFQFQQDIGVRQHMEPTEAKYFDSGETELNGMQPFERIFEDSPMDLDMENDLEIVCDPPQEQRALPNNFSTSVDATVAAGEQGMRSALVTGHFGIGTLYRMEMFDEITDLPMVNLNMSGGFDTIDPRLIFCNNSGDGYTF